MGDLWSNIILIVLVQGLFALSVLVLVPGRRTKQENRYLILIVLVLFWYLFEFYCIRNRIRIPINVFYGTRYGSWTLLGPLTYFYIRSIGSDWKFSPKDWLHLSPFFVLVLIVPWLSNESLSQRQIHYGMLAVFDHRPKTVTPFEYLYSSIFYLQFVHLATYLIINHFTIKRYTKELRSNYSNLNHTAWLLAFNGLVFLLLLLASGYLAILFVSDIYSRSLDYIYVVPIGLFIYAMSYKLSGLHWQKSTKPLKQYRTSSLKSEDIEGIKQQLHQLMKSQKPFLDNELRLKNLADILSISTHHLSRVINEGFGLSFFEYINQFRVGEAKALIAAEPSYTLLKVAFEAGFNNKTSFVNAFKKFEGITPSRYRKKVMEQLTQP